MGFHSLVEGLQDVWGLAHSLEGVLVLVTVVALVLAAFVHIVVLDVHIGLLGPVHNLVGGLRNNRSSCASGGAFWLGLAAGAYSRGQAHPYAVVEAPGVFC